ncbi:hypothetical protein ACMBCN_00195 [Candidatus Liberibacter asiaticus]
MLTKPPISIHIFFFIYFIITKYIYIYIYISKLSIVFLIFLVMFNSACKVGDLLQIH